MCLNLERKICERVGDGERALAGLQGALVVAHQPEVVGPIGAYPSQPMLVVQRLGERFGFSEVLPDPLEIAKRIERVASVGPKIDGLLARLAALREMSQRLQRLLEVGDRLAMRRARCRLRPGLAQVGYRLVPPL